MRDILERLICLALLQMYIPVYCIECVYIVPIVTAAGRRGVPLQHKAHDEGATDWGPPGVAPGLWVN